MEKLKIGYIAKELKFDNKIYYKIITVEIYDSKDLIVFGDNSGKKIGGFPNGYYKLLSDPTRNDVEIANVQSKLREKSKNIGRVLLREGLTTKFTETSDELENGFSHIPNNPWESLGKKDIHNYYYTLYEYGELSDPKEVFEINCETIKVQHFELSKERELISAEFNRYDDYIKNQSRKI